MAAQMPPATAGVTGPSLDAATAAILLVVRHGETDWNVEHRLQGQLDPGLNATGQLQAQKARIHHPARAECLLAARWCARFRSKGGTLTQRVCARATFTAR